MRLFFCRHGIDGGRQTCLGEKRQAGKRQRYNVALAGAGASTA